MNPTDFPKRRRRETRLTAEALESRELLTGGAGSTFALVDGTISKANQPAVIKFTIDPAHFTLPKGKLTLGIDIAPASGSTVKPSITSVDNSSGLPIPATHGRYTSGLSSTVKPGQSTSALLTQVQFNHKNPNGTATYTVNVRGLNGTTGAFLLGFYLPGDANGDGKVDSTDLTQIKSELGLKGSSSTYSFDADTNRDGVINAADVATASKNLGVSTTINPAVEAVLGTANEISAGSRNFSVPTAQFTGTATPGSSITYRNTSVPGSPATTATADAQGNYSINVALAKGTNTFAVSTLDAFGQVVSGTLNPVSYTPPTT